MADEQNSQQGGVLRRRRHHRPRGTRGGTPAPGMYIGSTGIRGLHHLVWEIVDNSVDEALAGHATQVDVTIHPDNSVTVKDNGRGIPVAVMEKEGKSALEVVLTVLHAGGKFGDGGGYKVSGGLHGVGSSVVNALSTTLHAEVRRDGFVHRQSYERGAPQGQIEQGEPTKETGTTITFAPDGDIFEETVFDWNILETRLRETSFLTKASRSSSPTSAARARPRPSTPRGRHCRLRRAPNAAKETMGRKIVYFEGESEEGSVEIAMQWNTTYQESVHSFANNINTHEGGSHLSASAARSPARSTGTPARRDSQGEGRQPLRRGHPRGPHRRHLGQARQPAVRGPDEDQAR